MHRLWVLASHWAATWPTCTGASWPRGVSSGASLPPSCQSLLPAPPHPSEQLGMVSSGWGEPLRRSASRTCWLLLVSLGRDAVQGLKPSELGRAWRVGLGPASG